MHHEGSRIVYSLRIYPDDFNNTSTNINAILLEINEKAIREIDGVRRNVSRN